MNDDWRVVQGEYSPAMHMALDEVITDRVASGEEVPTLRFWEWETPAVVIGRFQSVRDEVFMDMAEKEDVTVVRRSTGGGAMFTEPGRVITYSLSLPEENVTDDIVSSYRELEEWSINALNRIGVPAEHKPINDIVNGEQKVGGSAQARRNGTVLHHTMLAYNLDIETMLKVLRIGKEKISDKAIQSAEKAVSPIRSVVDTPRDEVLDEMLAEFSEGKTLHEDEVTAQEKAAAEKLANEKYGTDEWLYKVDREIEE